MANIVSINFDGTPPAEPGGGLGDHVPTGGYKFKVTKMGTRNSRKGKSMVVAEYRSVEGGNVPSEWLGKRITDNFTMPTPGTDESDYGLARFHAFYIAVGGENMEGKGSSNLDLDKFLNMEFVAEIIDETMQANGNNPARLLSKTTGYHRLGSKQAEEVLKLPFSGVVTVLNPAAVEAATPPAATTTPPASATGLFAAQPEQPQAAMQVQPEAAAQVEAQAPTEAAPAATEAAAPSEPAPDGDAVKDEINEMFAGSP